MAKDKTENAEAAEKPEVTPEEAAAKGKKKKMLIFIIGGVVTTAALGGGLAMVLSKSDAPPNSEGKNESAETAPAPAPAEPKKEEPKAEEKKDDKKPEPAKDAKDAKTDAKLPAGVEVGCNHQFKSFNLNLGNPLENRYIRLELAVEYACNDEHKTEIARREPQLRDAIIGVISKKTREFLLSPDGKAQLTHEIRNQINQRMSQPINDVYITDILIE